MSSRLHSYRPQQSRNPRSAQRQVQQADGQRLALPIQVQQVFFLFLILAVYFLTSPLSYAKGSVQAPQAQAPQAQAIASAHPLATQAGIRILNAGGNAFDAAITVASVLAVVEPYSSGFGGGGFWLIHQANTGKNTFIDGREKAPSLAHENIYVEASEKKASTNGPLAAGIPGQAAALVHLAENYGNLPLSQTLADAIHYAEHGFPVDRVYRLLTGFRLKAMQANKTTSKIFLGKDGQIPEEGHLIIQKALAETLRQLAQNGFDGFYKGKVASALVENMNTHKGVWQLKDLAQYSIVEREPIQFNINGYQFITAPPPSAGGIALAQMFGMLDHKGIRTNSHIKPHSPEQTQLLVEVMRRAYRDRAEYLGDPDYTDIPKKLLAQDYIQELAESIRPLKATSNTELKPVLPPKQGTDTTHYSILDREGNRVSATLSINLPFGSAYTDPDTGLLLNNEMDDFSSHPGTPNAYGLVATEANGIAPGKRPLSSMTPTFIEHKDSLAILGTPGGSRIITMVFLGALEHLNKQPVENWVSRKRFHHQYLPDVIQHEPNTFTEQEKTTLKSYGYQLKNIGRTYGNMQAILWDKKNGNVTAASDPRRVGQSVVSGARRDTPTHTLEHID